MSDSNAFMQEAIALSALNIKEKNGGPFGAVIVKDGQIVGRGYNHVVANTDPTAHGEVMAIRDACKNLGNLELQGCELYTSCEPCPMCLGAIYRARIEKIYYANTEKDAHDIGFDDEIFYDEFSKPLDQRKVPIEQIGHEEARAVFDQWKREISDIKY
ncbi:MAG: nucleoside deaminase [Candidatus Absconditabacterales bacterium]